MKFPALENRNRAWDQYCAFHYTDRWLTVFETGDAIITRNAFDPSERRYYPAYNLSITATGDGYFKFVLPDTDELIPQAWVTYSRTQYLLVDHDKMRAYPFGRRGALSNLAPNHARNACLYIPNEKAEPVTTGHVSVSRPDTELSKLARGWLKDVVALSKAVVQTNEAYNSLYAGASDFVVTRDTIAENPEDFVYRMINAPPTPNDEFYGKRQIKILAMEHYTVSRVVSKVPYLKVLPRF